MKILVTGASGFIGQYLVPYLSPNYQIETLSLRNSAIEGLNLIGHHTIIHLAGIAHQMNGASGQKYFDVNHKLTVELARKAEKQGVKHFVFLSSVKVYGEQSNLELDEHSACNPSDDYGRSKLMAEEELIQMSSPHFAVAVIRPPLVYGPGVKGNLANLIKLMNKIPFLPFGNINNKRSMVYVGNLAALIEEIMEQKQEGIFIAGDKNPYSTSDLVSTINKFNRSKTIIISLPGMVRNFLKWIKPDLYSRLFGSFVVSNLNTMNKLSFEPPFSFEEGIKDMVNNQYK